MKKTTKQITPKLKYAGKPFDALRMEEFRQLRDTMEWTILDGLNFAGAEFKNEAAKKKAVKMLAHNCAYQAVVR